MKTTAGIEKPLAEWTAQEIQDFCAGEISNNSGCNSCPIWDSSICRFSPNKWNLSEKPKFTEQEIQDAKAIMRIFGFESTQAKICRVNGAVIVNIQRPTFTDEICLSKNTFPSIRTGIIYDFSEIIGGRDD